MSHLTSNLLGVCPLGRKNCPYADSYCSDCMKHEKAEQKRKRQNRKSGADMRKGDFN